MRGGLCPLLGLVTGVLGVCVLAKGMCVLGVCVCVCGVGGGGCGGGAVRVATGLSTVGARVAGSDLSFRFVRPPGRQSLTSRCGPRSSYAPPL